MIALSRNGFLALITVCHALTAIFMWITVHIFMHRSPSPDPLPAWVMPAFYSMLVLLWLIAVVRLMHPLESYISEWPPGDVLEPDPAVGQSDITSPEGPDRC